MEEKQKIELRRSIGFTALVAYGVGTIVGGGFYALIGKVSVDAGPFTPLAFLLSCIIALLSAVSYAELSSRFPKSAGESFYALRAFGMRSIAGLTGWLVVLTGIVSAATLSVAVGGFLDDLGVLPDTAGRVVCIVSLAAVALWGVGQSVLLAALIAAVEVLGLVAIICLGAENIFSFDALSSSLTPPLSLDALAGIGAGAFLAFYSFIGFEDMVNMAEEVKEPEKTLPRAILVAVLITGVIYLLATLVAVSTVSLQELQQSNTPLALVAERQFSGSIHLFGIISVLAGVNGALVQIVMVSRVLFGMAREQMAPAVFSRLHHRTQTPIQATLFATAIILILALSFDLTPIAKLTSAIILVVFCVVNGSLIIIKVRDRDDAQSSGVSFPFIFPLLGLLSSVTFLFVNIL